MPPLLVILAVGTAIRLVVLFRRPSADRRFRARRRVLAKKIEQLGDTVVITTTITMLLFGFGHSPNGLVRAVWAVGLVGGFGAVFVAHDVARRYQPPPSGHLSGSSSISDGF